MIMIMKKNSILIALFCFNIAFSQNFPGKNVELLLNKTVKAKVYDETNQNYHYQNFFVKFDTLSYLSTYNNYAFPNSNNLYSQYDKLVNKAFKVVNIFREHEISTPGYTKNSFILELHNDTIGKLYYKYDAEYDFNYELEVVGGLNLPSEFYCQDITFEKDIFTKEKTYTSPIKDGITIIKTVNKGISSLYMSILEIGNTANVGKTGVYLLLENGMKISKPNVKISIDANTNNYRYSCFFTLTPNDISLLKKYKITDKRLYIYDGSVNDDSANYVRGYINCLSK